MSSSGFKPAVTASPAMSHLALAMTPVALAVQFAIATSLYIPTANAQTNNTTAFQAQSAALHNFNISAGTLSATLTQFLRETGIFLISSTTLTQGKNSPGVQGEMSIEAALEQLLSGTGLEAVRDNHGQYVLQVSTQNDAMVISESGPTKSASLDMPKQTSSDNASLEILTVTGVGGHPSYTVKNTNAATGLNLSLRETPQSVTVLTRQRMDDQALNSLGMVLDHTPGISHSSGTDYAGYTYTYSRGYRIANIDVDGLPGSGGMTVGGLGGWYDISSLETAIYDSVTVIRGASGFLQGAGDPSGSISLTRKKPTRDFQASIEGGLGSWNKRRMVGDVSGALNQAGTIRGRLVGVYDEGESWKDRYEGERDIFYGVLEADLTDSTLLRMTLDHQKAAASNDAQGTFFPILLTDGSSSPFSSSDNAVTDWTRFNRKSTNLSARIEHAFNSRWLATAEYSRLWGDNKGVFGNIAIGLQPDGTGRMHLRNYSNDQEWEGINLKLNGQYSLFGRDHGLVIGFNKDTIKLDSTFIRDMTQLGTWDDWNGGFPEPDWSTYTASLTDSETKQTGLYLATHFHVTDNLSLLLGGRLSDWQTSSKNKRTGLVTDNRKENDVFTPYVAVMYELTPQLTAYASYTEIFNPQSVRDVNDKILEPEEGTNKEIGLKGEWLDGRLNTSFAIFESGKNGLALRDGNNLTPNGDTAYIAADDTIGRGWEIEVSGELAPGWQIQGGYTRMVLKDSDGDRLVTQEQPKHMFKLFTAWTPTIMNQLTVGGGLRWQSETYDASNPLLRSIYTQDSYTVVDLMARYLFTENLSLSVNLNNAFDKEYRHSLLAYHYYGPSRNIYASLKYQF